MQKYFYKDKKILTIIITILVIFSVISIVYAKENGISGKTSTTSSSCGACHSPSPSSSVTLSVTSATNSFTVGPNSTTTFTITIKNSTLVTSGIDIAVKTTETGETNIGILTPATGSNLKVLSNELVHQSPIALTNGQASFTFTWTAPSTSGTYYLRAVGLAANNNNRDDSGDLWNWMVPQVITVQSETSVFSPISHSDVFPNPVFDYIQFPDLQQIPNYYSIFDQNGQIIQSNEFREKIDVSKLSAGVYFITLNNNNQIYKFVKM